MKAIHNNFIIGDFFKIMSWLLAFVMVAKSMTKMYIITEIILINNSLCVLTQDNGKGWELTDKDNIVISFDKYKSDITVSQDLIIGYVKDGIMYEGEVFDELSGKYSFSPDEKGEYFFYLLSGSSDYLSLKSGNLEVN